MTEEDRIPGKHESKYLKLKGDADWIAKVQAGARLLDELEAAGDTRRSQYAFERLEPPIERFHVLGNTQEMARALRVIDQYAFTDLQFAVNTKMSWRRLYESTTDASVEEHPDPRKRLNAAACKTSSKADRVNSAHRKPAMASSAISTALKDLELQLNSERLPELMANWDAATLTAIKQQVNKVQKLLVKRGFITTPKK